MVLVNNTDVWDSVRTGPEIYKTVFMLSSAEAKFYPAHKCYVGILTFISRINYRLWLSEHEISTNFCYFSNNLNFMLSLVEHEKVL